MFRTTLRCRGVGGDGLVAFIILLGEDHFQRPNRRFEDGRFFQVVSGFGPESRSFFFRGGQSSLVWRNTRKSRLLVFFSLNQDSKSMVKLNKLNMLYEPI